jgi:hypothetical protein
MKKLALLLLFCFLFLTALNAFNTGKSVFFADSYMLRAKGVEAAYWNPANLQQEKGIDFWIPIMNLGIGINNNSLDLDTYNYVVSRDTLNDIDKQKILNKIDGSLRSVLESNISIVGFAFDNMSLSSSLHLTGKLALSERYLDLLLYGNTDSLYVFDKSTTDAGGLGYVDLTFGIGNLVLPYIPETIPPIRAGFSVSALVGIGNANLDDFFGYFSSSMEGVDLKQDIVLHTGLGGFGQKAMLGLASNITPNLEVGLTLDNLFGKINWFLTTEETTIKVVANDVYAANISEEIYDYANETVDIDSYSTKLPPELRLGTLYKIPWANFSLDYLQGFKTSIATSGIGRFSLAAQFLPWEYLHLNIGVGFGNRHYPWRISYGIGYSSKVVELGFGLQSVKNLIPGYKTKGIAIGSYMKVHL